MCSGPDVVSLEASLRVQAEDEPGYFLIPSVYMHVGRSANDLLWIFMPLECITALDAGGCAAEGQLHFILHVMGPYMLVHRNTSWTHILYACPSMRKRPSLLTLLLTALLSCTILHCSRFDDLLRQLFACMFMLRIRYCLKRMHEGKANHFGSLGRVRR